MLLRRFSFEELVAAGEASICTHEGMRAFVGQAAEHPQSGPSSLLALTGAVMLHAIPLVKLVNGNVMDCPAPQDIGAEDVANAMAVLLRNEREHLTEHRDAGVPLAFPIALAIADAASGKKPSDRELRRLCSGLSVSSAALTARIAYVEWRSAFDEALGLDVQYGRFAQARQDGWER